MLALGLAAPLGAQGGRDFVTVSDGELRIGSRPYHFLGVNLWFGMNLGAAHATGDRARLVRELDRLASLGVTNLRVMAATEGPPGEPWRVHPSVQPGPGEYDERLLRGLDFLLAELAKRDMRAVLVLNNFFQWSGGMAQYVSWATGDPIPYPMQDGNTWDEFQRFSARFYDLEAAKRLFEQYVGMLIDRRNHVTGVRYRDDPTIMSWQLSNEPRGFVYTEEYVAWVDRAASFVQERAPHQLVSLGGEGKLTPHERTQFARVARSPSLDYLTIHLWIENWGWYRPARPEATFPTAVGRAMGYLAEHLAVAEQVGKPLVLEEFGVSRDGLDYSPTAPVAYRDEFYRIIFEALHHLAAEGTVVAGGNVWSWAGTGRPVEPGGFWSVGDPYTGDPPHELQGWYSIYDHDTTTLALIREYARRMAEIDADPPVTAELELSPLVSDGMAIQRDARVPVRGTAAPGTAVRVSFDGQTLSTEAGEDGHWAVVLDPRPAGGPHRLTIAAGDERRTVRDVVVGDVWLASGQSNMEWTVEDVIDADREIAAADDPLIRHFGVPRSWSYEPARELAGGEWEVSDSAHVAEHSAVAYFFARSLREHVAVPIGIINNAWGGARIEPYMSAAALGLDAAGVEEIRAVERSQEEQVLEELRRRIGGLPASDRGMIGDRPVWADPGLDASDWARLAVPGYWESEYEGLNGVGWYRRTVELSAEEAAAPVALGLGRIDDADITWVNGHEVGGMEEAWNRTRVYEVPPEALRPGENVLVVRVEDTGGGGGILGEAELLYLETVAGRRSLAGEWRFRVGAVSRDFEGERNQIPTLLYNQMVHPLTDYPITGVIWYQGESNAYPGDAYEYRRQFRTMIRSWRDAWGQPDLPFLWVQLANYMEPGDGTQPSDWAVLRESQSAALSLPATAEVVAIDVGEADDIHPRNKQDVGARLARAARAVAYGEAVEYSGPRYSGHRVRPDGRVEIRFDHVDGGLVARDSSGLGGFVIAGRDGDFVPARAVIEGDHVVVWSEAVSEPAAVRYAWADNPMGANLYNEIGLPAAPFRTAAPDEAP